MARVTRTVRNADGSTTTTTKGGCEDGCGWGCTGFLVLAVIASPAYYLPHWAAALVYVGVVALAGLALWGHSASQKAKAGS